MKSKSFIHISDLHFSKYEGSKSTKEEISHFNIKKKIFDYIGIVIQNLNIGAVIISGDLELDSVNDIIPYFIEWLSRGSKIFIAFGEHDLKEKREELILGTIGLDNIYYFEEPNIIKDKELDFAVYGMSCEQKQIGFKNKFNSLNNLELEIPSIFLTHPCQLSKGKMISLGCQYFAVGHIHYRNIKQISDNVYMGRPGHIYSIWDGDGKASPVGAILGEFRDNSIHLDWLEFPVPQTIRLYIDPFKTKGDKLLLCIENCSEASSKKVLELCEGIWVDEGSRGVFKAYFSTKELPIEKITRYILNIFIDDIFVTPSDSINMKKKYGYSRASFTSRTLLNDKNIFNEYLDRILKATDKTQ